MSWVKCPLGGSCNSPIGHLVVSQVSTESYGHGTSVHCVTWVMQQVSNGSHLSWVQVSILRQSLDYVTVMRNIDLKLDEQCSSSLIGRGNWVATKPTARSQ